MTRVKELEKQISKLTSLEFGELRDWILQQDAEGWDAQIERDAGSGGLDRLFAKSLTDHAAGKSLEL